MSNVGLNLCHTVAHEIFGHFLQAIVGHAQLRKAQGMQDGIT